MRMSSALVLAVLIWSSARYLPSYFLAIQRMDVEEEKMAIEHTHSTAMLHQMRLQQTQAHPAPAKGPDGQAQTKFY